MLRESESDALADALPGSRHDGDSSRQHDRFSLLAAGTRLGWNFPARHDIRPGPLHCKRVYPINHQ